jgi:uncharacterized pyridoxal phosphate-containing UPF0001 family protein
MSVRERIGEVRERIEKACIRSGRKAAEVRLMGVSKFHGAEEVEEALKGGLSLFGENRVQEALGKFPPLKSVYKNLELHMIGSLQRNKVKNALTVFDGIQSLDRDELITALGTLTSFSPPGFSLPLGGEKLGGEKPEASDPPQPLRVLLELHTGEESKAGYPDTDSLLRAAELALSFPGLRLSGLMTMAPFTGEEALIRASFRTLVEARDLLQRRFPEGDFSCLSMGMSNDFETAIEEGSTLVRVGTAIFGERR